MIGIMSHPADTLASPRRRISAGPWLFALAAALLMAMACGMTFVASGATLGLAFGIVFCMVILLPGLYAMGPGLRDRLAAAGGGFFGAALVLLLAGWLGRVMSFPQGLLCLGVILTLSVAMVGGIECLVRLRVARSVAAAMMLVLGVLWLSWPVWMGPLLASDHLTAGQSQQVVSILVPAHPLLSINGVLIHRGVWNEQSGVAYQLTNLAQDIPYAMPRGASACMGLHGLIAAGFWLLAMLLPKCDTSDLCGRSGSAIP